MRSFAGVVQRGSGRGAELGFPTANISLTGSTVSGIYAARVKMGGKEYQAAVYADQKRKVLEAHLLNFGGDLYGKEVTVALLKKIRDGQRFDSDAALSAAIADDVAKIREYFKN